MVGDHQYLQINDIICVGGKSDKARPAPPPRSAQTIKEAVNPFILPDSEEQLEERTLDFLQDKVKSLSALKKATV